MSLDVTLTDDGEVVFTANMTHNLNKMAECAGVYFPVWRPEEVDILKASQLIAPISTGLEQLHARPEEMKALNPPNGWGTYDFLVQFLSNYLSACKQWPDATVSVCR
jgi:hypothetical protein